MIETTQTVPVHVNIDGVWEYVKNIRNWAELMPGLKDCDIIDDDNSHWVLKVGVGAMVRTVKVNVHVDQWDGPERVFFSFKLQGDPVSGGGSYLATPTGDNGIDMTLTLQIEGTGPMAPMWEAMGGPLLPKFALAFAKQLAEGIEESAVASGAAPERPAAAAKPSGGGLFGWLKRLWRLLAGK